MLGPKGRTGAGSGGADGERRGNQKGCNQRRLASLVGGIACLLLGRLQLGESLVDTFLSVGLGIPVRWLTRLAR